MTRLSFVGEDEVSFHRHCKALQNEFKKKNPNAHIVNELMQLSFGLRRKDINENPRELQSVFEKVSISTSRRSGKTEILVIIIIVL